MTSFFSAWADGCLIASMSCIARLTQKQQKLQQTFDVDLERSAADTKHAAFVAEDCDGVRSLQRLRLFCSAQIILLLFTTSNTTRIIAGPNISRLREQLRRNFGFVVHRSRRIS
jgi:hypothetical protein